MTTDRTYILMHQTITGHDAIGNDIERMSALISDRLGGCVCYADNRLNKNIKYISREELDQRIKSPDTVIIYHHSVFWEEGEKILSACRCPVIFRYHNITPDSFFMKYSTLHYEQCKKGRELTKRLVRNHKSSYWICDSRYNASDIEDVPEEKKLICPPFNYIDKWGTTPPVDSIVDELFTNRCVNLLFVGRIVPNKNITVLLDIVHNYIANYDIDIVLRIIGKFDDNLKSYNDEIKDRIKAFGIEKNVIFIGEVNDEILTSYYLASDLFVCVSEHEGFFVPAVEAQYFGLPVIALDSTAVPDTCGNGALLLQKNMKLFVSAIHILKNNSQYRLYFQENGFRNYESRFTESVISETFINCLKKCLGE